MRVNICLGYRVAERTSHLCFKIKLIYTINVHAGGGKSVSMLSQGTFLSQWCRTNLNNHVSQGCNGKYGIGSVSTKNALHIPYQD